ncbi:MAG: hypothetical protein GWN32_02400, partial [Gemmatimonadetes bacterium]|nr:hypothetical protein [Gemmatimonadota bacterium]
RLRSYSGAILAADGDLDEFADHLEEQLSAHADAVQQIEMLLSEQD